MTCTHCGCTLPEDAVVCARCGEPVVPAPEEAPVPAEIQPEIPAEDAQEPVLSTLLQEPQPTEFVYEQPEPKRKSHTGLIVTMCVTALLLIGAGVAAVMTNFFGLLGGPLDDLMLAAQKSADIRNAHIDSDISMTAAGTEMNIIMDMDVDYTTADAVALGTYTISAPSVLPVEIKADMGIADGRMVLSLMGQKLSFKAGDALSQIPQSGSMPDIRQAFERLKATAPELYDSITKVLDLDMLNACMPNVMKVINSRKWLEQNTHFTRTEGYDGTLYHFELNLANILPSLCEPLHPAFRDEAVYENVKNKNVADLPELVMVYELRVSNGDLCGLHMQMEQDGIRIDMTMTYSQFNAVTVDTDAIHEMLDGALDMGDLAANDMFG